MHYPNVNKEIAKVIIGVIIYLGFLVTLLTAMYRMSSTGRYYKQELFLAAIFLLLSNIFLFKVLKSSIKSALLLFEGIDIFMKSKLEDYFEARDYYIIKHGEYQAGLYFNKRPEGPYRLWELGFEKRIQEVNSNFDSSRIKYGSTNGE